MVDVLVVFNVNEIKDFNCVKFDFMVVVCKYMVKCGKLRLFIVVLVIEI